MGRPSGVLCRHNTGGLGRVSSAPMEFDEAQGCSGGTVSRRRGLALCAWTLTMGLGGCPQRPTEERRDAAPRVNAAATPRATDGSTAPSDAPTPTAAPARSDRWTRAYSDDVLDPATLQAWMAEAAEPDGESAAFGLGRRAPINALNAALGRIPSTRMDAFLRGLVGRQLGAVSIPAGWTARWAEEPPSVALGTLLGKNPIALDPAMAARSEPMLLDGDLEHQVAGARSLQNATVPIPPVGTLLGLHPVALALAARSLGLHGGVASRLWVDLLTSVGARVRSNPRSWAGAWMALVDAAPTGDSAVRSALLGLEPTLAEISLSPTGVQAAFHCSVALRLDRLDQGHRSEACATGPEEWRSLATVAERSRPPMEVRLVDSTLRNVLSRAADQPRVLEAVAQSAAFLPPATAQPLLLLLVESRDPGVLATLIEALRAHPDLARAFPASAIDRLLQVPFELPEAQSLEARLQAVRLRRLLGRPDGDIRTTIRAIRLAVAPDGGVAPQAAVSAPASVAGTCVINTSAGFIRIELRGDTAPETLLLLRDAIAAGTYRRTTFHRVVAGFVAQGGDPRGDGYGGITRIVPTEISGARFERGAVGIALAGLDTGGTQFFITLADAPHLDARYPYLGRVVSGLSVADRLMAGDEINDVTFVPASAATP